MGKRVRKGVRPPNALACLLSKRLSTLSTLPSSIVKTIVSSNTQPVQDQINSSRHPLPAPKSLIGRFPFQGTPLSIMTQGWQSPTTSHAISFTALVMSQSVGTLNLNSSRLPVPLPLHRDEIRMRDGPRNTSTTHRWVKESNQFSTEHDHSHVFITERYLIL